VALNFDEAARAPEDRHELIGIRGRVVVTGREPQRERAARAGR